MSMSFWVVLSWVFVFILTAVNVAIFLKLKQASEQMMGSMFPGQNMKDVMANMQGMMAGMQGKGGGGARGGSNPFAAMQQNMGGKRPGSNGKQNMDAQLKAAMEMLNKMQKR